LVNFEPFIRGLFLPNFSSPTPNMWEDRGDAQMNRQSDGHMDVTPFLADSIMVFLNYSLRFTRLGGIINPE